MEIGKQPATASAGQTGVAESARAVFLGSIGITLLLYLIPFGDVVETPLRLFATMVHELGHGVAALLVGGEFRELVIEFSGNGHALIAVPPGLASAFTSASGLIGPSVGAAFGFIAARRVRSSRIFLGLLGGFLLFALIVARSPAAFLAIGVTSATCIGVAWKASPKVARNVLVFFSVQLGLSLYSDLGYMFSDSSHKGLSDSAAIGKALAGPYWFWGLVCVVISAAALALGGWYLLRNEGNAKN